LASGGFPERAATIPACFDQAGFAADSRRSLTFGWLRLINYKATQFSDLDSQNLFQIIF
jgi:hypothetical protein